jgi:Glycosyl hydrolases family 16
LSTGRYVPHRSLVHRPQTARFPRLRRAYQPTRRPQTGRKVRIAPPPIRIPRAVLSRLLLVAGLTTVLLSVPLAASGSLGVDADAPRSASMSTVRAGGADRRLDDRASRAVLDRKPPARTPRPIRGDGYRVVFKDTFWKLRRRVWCSHQWWEPRPQPGTQYVRRGVLHLVRRRSDDYENVTVSSERCGQANPKSFKYGYMEARMRYRTVRGNGPAFWLLPSRFEAYADSPNWNPNVPPPFCANNGLPVAKCYAAELDVFEGFGNIQYGGTRQDDWFSGALHRNTNSWFGVPDQVRGVATGTGAELEQYHTYSAKWTRAKVCWYFDGRLVGCRPTFDSTNQPMYLLFYNWNTPWEDENMPNANTPDRLDVSVGWVRVWRKR